jgi:3-hydroxyanthranilate 3,4-dioxygenase
MLYEEKMQVGDIVKDLPSVMEKFYANEELRTCKNCGTVLEPPK